MFVFIDKLKYLKKFRFLDYLFIYILGKRERKYICYNVGERKRESICREGE